MNTIKDLQTKVQSLRDELKAALNAALLEGCPIKVGDVVISGGTRHRVASVNVRGWDPNSDQSNRWNRPTLSAYRQRKDGSWGTGAYKVWRDWKKEE